MNLSSLSNKIDASIALSNKLVYNEIKSIGSIDSC